MKTEANIPIAGLALTISDGEVWLHFSSDAGLQASLNMEALAQKQAKVLMEHSEELGVTGRALMAWCSDRHQEATAHDALVEFAEKVRELLAAWNRGDEELHGWSRSIAVPLEALVAELEERRSK